MKHFKLLYSLAAALLLTIGSAHSAFAQANIAINGAGDSLWSSPCPVPLQVEFYVYGSIPSGSLNDSVNISINFGDGTDTLLRVPISTQPFIPVFYGFCTHTYQYAGSYTVQYIVSDDNGDSDTLTVPNEVLVGDNCGNLSGTIYIDDNSNCQLDQGEATYANTMVTASLGGNVVGWDYTNQNGEYSFDLPAGNTYTINVGTSLPGVTGTCPPGGTLSVSTIPSSGNDIGLECLGGFDMTADVSGWGIRPGFTGTIRICPENLRCVPTSGQAILVVNDPLLTYSSANPSPDQVNGDTLVWNYSNLFNTVYGSCITVLVETDTTAQIGDTVCLPWLVTPEVGDADQSNNTGVACIDVRASWDPNDKAVSPAGVGATGKILNNTRLTYTVRFQNTGTAPAANIYILDTLDANLDVSSFRVHTASHPMDLYINGNDRVKFSFPDIWLADSTSNEPESHGFVIFSIDQLPDLANGTEIENTAHIYFDYNEPVVTNTVLNTIDLTLSIEEDGKLVPLNISIYPNPANDFVNITLDRQLDNATISLLDIAGRVVATQAVNGATTMQLQTGQLSQGVYILTLDANDSEVVRRKIVLVK